jgi:hypothetical protein
MTEDYIRNKVYDLEKEKLVVDSNTSKVLADIRDLLMAYTIIRLTELAGNPNIAPKNYERAKSTFVETKKSIEKRWSE